MNAALIAYDDFLGSFIHEEVAALFTFIIWVAHVVDAATTWRHPQLFGASRCRDDVQRADEVALCEVDGCKANLDALVAVPIYTSLLGQFTVVHSRETKLSSQLPYGLPVVGLCIGVLCSQTTFCFPFLLSLLNPFSSLFGLLVLFLLVVVEPPCSATNSKQKHNNKHCFNNNSNNQWKY